MGMAMPAELLELVREQEMAICAFNVHNMEYTQAVVWAAEEENMPVILMLGEPILPFAGLDMLANIALFAAQNAKVPVAVLLDHGKEMANIDRCLELGISVMFDGSALPFEENVALTRAVVERAHARGLSVEGELGTLLGVEDLASATTAQQLTDPEMAWEFAERTGVDALAIAIGNCHGKYEREPLLDFERLEKIRQGTKTPLVLHGGSDLPAEMSRRAIAGGIRKFNVGTELKYAMCECLREELCRQPMPFQPQDTFGPARQAVKEAARQRLHLMKNGGNCQYS